MSKKLILYEIETSPPVRAVKILAEALNLELELRTVNLYNKEQYDEKYLKLNPNHTVPILDDNGFILWDSHAIMVYLMDKYAKNDSLYPRDLKKRSLVNQFLFCDADLFAKLIAILRPLFYGDEKEIPPIKIEAVKDSYRNIEAILRGNIYISGNDMTIADISLITTLTSLDLVEPMDPKQYPNIRAWIGRMENLPYYKSHLIGLEKQAIVVRKIMGK